MRPGIQSLLLVIAVAMLLPRCATMTSGKYETITVDAQPASTVSLDCAGTAIASQRTPASIRIRRNAGDCTLVLEEPGYKTETVVLEQGVNRAYWLNFGVVPLVPVGAVFIAWHDDDRDVARGAAMLAGGTIGWLVDQWTGAAHAHTPAKINAVLRPNTPTP